MATVRKTTTAGAVAAAPKAKETEAAKKPGVTKATTKADAAGTAKFEDTKSVGGVTAKGLNPAVSPEMQKATYERVFQLGRQLVKEGKLPVIVLDHRLTALDDRPIVRKGFENLVAQYNVTELKDLDAAMKNGTLKSLPGYTAEASNHWRQQHPELVAKYPQAFGGTNRMNINFMGYSVREADATKGIDELAKRWKLETDGKGEIIFAGAGTGTREDFASVYQRPVNQGGAGMANPDVRFGAPGVSGAGDAKARAAINAFNAAHPGEGVVHDHDSQGKAGWIETIEKENVNGQQRVVAAFIDDRAHNRFAAQAVGVLGERMLAIKAAAPGLSFAQADNGNTNQISTFSPNP